MSRNLPELILVGVTSGRAELDISIDLADGDHKVAKGPLDEITKAFVHPGELGGYPSPGTRPRNSRLRPIANAIASAGLGFAVEAERVDPRAFQLLRNMAARLRIEDVEVRRITVRARGLKAATPVVLPEPDDDNEDDVYPPTSDILGFEVFSEEEEPSYVRRCLLEYRSSLLGTDVLEVAKWVEPWFELLEQGAFAMPWGFPEEADSLRGSISQFDDITLEIVVDRFRASESAWNVLVNLLESYAGIDRLVTKIEME
jgi:hypothetical protein